MNLAAETRNQVALALRANGRGLAQILAFSTPF